MANKTTKLDVLSFLADADKDLDHISISGCRDYPALWERLQDFPKLHSLEIGFGTMLDCSAFRPLASLTELNLVYLKKLTDIRGIAALKGTLKSLKFDVGAGTNVTDWSPLAELTNLEELVFCNHTVISDLRFLAPLTRLNNLRIVETKIKADDLSPLRAIESVSYFHTGIDRKLDAYLTESQRDFRIKVQERVKQIAQTMRPN